MNLNITEKEAMIIRSALSSKAIFHLKKSYEVEKELEELGRTDTDAVDWELDLYEICHKLMHQINIELNK